MTLITQTLISDGSTIDASDVNTPISTIYNDYNGSITNANISATAAIAGSKLATGTAGVGNAQLNTAAGDVGGAWKAWTPVWANLTVGSGTNVGYYTQLGKTIHFVTMFTLAADSSVGTIPTVTLPVAAKNASTAFIGMCLYVDTGTENYVGLIDGTGALRIENVAGTYPSRSSVTATIPFTWITNDVLNVFGTYETE